MKLFKIPIPFYVPLSPEMEKQYADTIRRRFIPLVRACLLGFAALETGEAIWNYLTYNTVLFPHSRLVLIGFYLVLLGVTYMADALQTIQATAVIGLVGVVFSMALEMASVPNGIGIYASSFFIPLQVVPLMPSFHAALAALIFSTAVIFDFARHTGVSPETMLNIKYFFIYYGLISAVISYVATQYRRASFKLEKSLEQAKKEAEAATAAKSTFLATMSHEVRTPLNGILGLITLIKDTQLDRQQKDYIETIKYSGETLLTILNDILDFSKMEAGKFDLEEMGFSVGRLISSVVTLMKSRAHEKGLQLDYKIDAGVPEYIMSDPTRIRQVLLNLISNAIKFTGNGFVHVHISCPRKTDTDAVMRFEVCDTGIGIPEETQKNLFQEFVQADSSTSRKFGGTGLGLAICKKIIELMHGKIGVTSVQGEGSTFWLEVPAKITTASQVEAVQAEDHAAAGQIPASRPLHVLVAEDNRINQKVITGLLERAGHSIIIAENGEEAMKLLRTPGAGFDLVLMDMQMPVMDGLAAATNIRALQNTNRDIPIIALTANNIKGDEQRCLAAGMNGYVSKPIDPAALYNAMSKYVPDSVIPGRMQEPVVPVQMKKPGFEKLTELEQTMGSDYVKKFVEEGLTEIGVLMDQLCGGSDSHAMRRAAHDLKSLSDLFGLNDLQALAEGIEMCCADNSVHEAIVLGKMLRDRYENNVSALRNNYLSAM